jgi:hypothetical protein
VESVRLALHKGDGVFWRIETPYLRMISYKKVHRFFDVKPHKRYVDRVPADEIGGHVRNFRGHVVAAKAALAQGDVKGDPVDESLMDFTDRLGISRPTLYRFIEDGWLRRTPQVEVKRNADVDIYAGMKVIWEDPDHSKERLWEGVDGKLYVVRQTHNLYQSRYDPGDAPLDPDLGNAYDPKYAQTNLPMSPPVPQGWSW